MKFTLKRPTKPGYYWINDTGEITIVHVYYSSAQKKTQENLEMVLLGNSCGIALKEMDYFLWGDKIEEPNIE